jgi:hypothetical protein
MEVGLRLRGAITPRLSYGATAQWLGLSLSDVSQKGFETGLQRDRLHRESAGIGLGYLLSRRTLVSLDLSGGISRLDSNGRAGRDLIFQSAGGLDNRLLSAHLALQRDITKRLFASASYLEAWRSRTLAPAPGTVALFSLLSNPYQAGNRWSDFGVGWRFSPDFTAQYLYSTSYGSSYAAHAILLRYTFRLKRE